MWEKSELNGVAYGMGNPSTKEGVGKDEYKSIRVDVLRN